VIRSVAILNARPLFKEYFKIMTAIAPNGLFHAASSAGQSPGAAIAQQADCPNSVQRWLHFAIAQIEADFQRSADTHLIALQSDAVKPFADAGIDIYFKDESTHPTGSLKHRLARSLFLYALCNGWIGEGQTIIEASSGSTAVSEAYFARLLGLPFIAVMPHSTSREKIALIEFYGGRCHFVEKASDVYDASRTLARESRGHYMDQFTYAERATDWRGNNNIAESMFTQMSRERHPIPSWIVVGAGTGGTSATIGRYVRYHRHNTQLCVADPEGSVFANYHATGDATLCSNGSKIEGIGRPRVEPSFIRELVDRMIVVNDEDSIAAMHALSTQLSRKVGPSTGTNFHAVIRLAKEMMGRGECGSILSLICDAGDRYLPTYFNDEWVRGRFADASLASK
jgi:cysteine synthase